MTPPTPTSALQKARELAELSPKEIWSIHDFIVNPQYKGAISIPDLDEDHTNWQHIIASTKKERSDYIVALHNAFPSIHAELERVTAERDAALKGHRAMRVVIDEWLPSSHDPACAWRFHEDHHMECTCGFSSKEQALTSFPEIK